MKAITEFRWFGWLTLAIVAGYFVVGLWPFDFRPPNHVRWLANRAGLQFEPGGVAYDPDVLPAQNSSNAAGQSANFTVELWVEAGGAPATDVFHLLTIHNRSLPSDFILCQWQNEILLRAAIQNPRPHKINEVGVDNALPPGQAHFIAVRGNENGTDFFLDGQPAGHFPQFVLTTNALAGQLILGNGSSGKNPWTGKWLGLAIFNRALATAEIASHQARWTQGRALQLTNDSSVAALYLFDEGGGQHAKDSSAHHHALAIPDYFHPVHKEFLIPPWKDLSYDHPDYQDIAVNISGFLPFGFCFFLHLNFRKKNQPAANILRAVFAGAAISLAIEITQAWLPGRDSSATDVLANVLGAWLGAVLARAMCRKIAAG